jgi:three-Cys-motif partner protein
MVEHRYGGTWTDIKLEAVEYYLRCYTAALSKVPFDLWYIDGFAGTGTRTADREAGGLLEGKPIEIITETLDGSARRALGVTPPFHHFRFIEQDAARCAALDRLKAEFPTADIGVIRGNANVVLKEFCDSAPWIDAARSRSRGVVFLDPYALHVERSTLEALARTQLLDVWYLFPLQSIVRQLAHDYKGIGPKERRLDITLGPQWRDLYEVQPARSDLFDFSETSSTRIPSKSQIESWFKSQLESSFAYVSDPLPILTGPGLQAFSLFLCVSNPSNPAVDLAKKFVRHVMKHYGPRASRQKSRL